MHNVINIGTIKTRSNARSELKDARTNQSVCRVKGRSVDISSHQEEAPNGLVYSLHSRAIRSIRPIIHMWFGVHLFGSLGQEGDQVIAVLLLLQSTERHLGTGDVLLGVLEVVEQRLLVPGDALLLVGISVGKALNLTTLAAKETVQLRADLVALTLLQGVALSTSCLEKVGTLLGIA
jgi:hypothetical protein